ncbi:MULTISPECIES: glycoside hydrolase family protein [Flavobacteriaceae]|uniref:glycoside hydrolase family protein n=1 Tax=Flavobacteriaceae TaxID=49546 RepID=UPI00234A0465|nr:glycoside hydrolase family protein [Muricauda sp. SP22]MDC6362375.1 glycoside hydrolase family protein [Muricauda sp. SP22]
MDKKTSFPINVLMLFVANVFLWSCNENKTLTIHPLPIDATIQGDILEGPSVLNDPDRFVWGGSVLKGDDGKYHMLYSTWEAGDSVPKFTDSWVLHSKIAYAVSDYPDRDFKFQKVVLQGRVLEGDSLAWDAQMVHNPHLKRFNGTYYLYYIGSKDPGPQPQGSKGENVNKRNRVQQSQKIGVILFNNFQDLMSGNFKRPDQPLLSPRTRVKSNDIVDPSPEGTQAKPDNIIVVNPAVVQRPSDGKFLLFFKGNLYEPHWKGVHGVAISNSPTGPFVPSDDFVFDIKDKNGKISSAEDPYVWYHQKHKRFYAVFKDFTGNITGKEPGLAVLESLDGLDWTKPESSFFMAKEVILKNSDTIKVHHLERPQLLLDDIGNPLVLYGACSLINVGPRKDGSSFNVQIPLKIN